MDIYLGPAVFGCPEGTIIKLIFSHEAKRNSWKWAKKKKKSQILKLEKGREKKWKKLEASGQSDAVQFDW